MTAADEPTRRQAIDKELKAVETKADQERERERLPWKDERLLFDVIRLPLDMVALNPNSHRIKPQLESVPPERRELISNDPYSAEAQAIIAEIIEDTEGFADVFAEMEERGQEEPGVVTRAGVLINANTRVVALRKLNAQGYVNVMVLPPDPDPKDIARLELDLQERREVKQPYSFVASLMFQEELISDFGYSDEDTAKALRIDKDPKKAVADVQQRTRILSYIREMQTRSEGRVPLTHFNKYQVGLAELDTAYQALRRTDPVGAERVKEARFLGILAGVGYERLRQIDGGEKVTEYVITALTGDDVAAGPVRDAIRAALTTTTDEESLPGLDLLGDEAAVDSSGNLPALVDLVARSHGQDSITLETAEGPAEVSWDQVRAPIAEAIDQAAEDAKSQTEAEKSLGGPAKMLDDARRNVDRARIAYAKIATHKEFDAKQFTDELNRLALAVEAVRAEVDKLGTQ